jgi:hypothetical protein
VVTRWLVSTVMMSAAQSAGVPLVDLLKRASEVLDAPIFYEPYEVADCTVDVGGELDAKVNLPRDEFLVLFEKWLHERRFAHLERTIGPVHSHAVMHLDPDRMKNLSLKTVVRRVDWNELATMADREALVITTGYCTTIPAEQVVAKIEARFDGSKVEDIRHVEGTNAIVMHAFATKLAPLLQTCVRLGVRPAEHEVVALPPESSVNQGEASVVLRCEPRGLRLSSVVDQATRLVGDPFFYDARPTYTENDRFAEVRIDFTGEIRVDRGNVLAWLDAILAQTPISRQTRIVASQPIQVLWSHRRYGRSEARSVPADELTACYGEYVTTAVALERLSSREMINSVCCRFGGWDNDFVHAIDGTNAMDLTGAADKLAVYVALARELDLNATIEAPKPTDQRSNK